jgi:outer membrane protein
MKKVLFVLSVLVVSVAGLKAQTVQGTFSVGGAVGVSNEKDENDGEDTRSSEFNFSPSVGYFVIDNLMVGANLSIVNGKEDDGFGGDDKYSAFFFGPFARYYKFTSNEQFAFFAEGGFQFGTYKDKPDGQNETKAGAFQFYVSPGFAYFFNEHWVVDLSFQAISFTSYDPDKDNDNDKSTTFNFGFQTFNPSIGVRYNFGN